MTRDHTHHPAHDELEVHDLNGTAADETVEFTSIFPSAYDGRWPHMHFEGYPIFPNVPV